MADKPTETQPPATDPETGVAMYGDYPLNSRLRAEALSAAGVATDPEELVTDGLIADAGARVAALAAADAEAEAAAENAAKRAGTELGKMTTAQLEETALAEGVDLAEARTNGDRVGAIEAHRAGVAAGTIQSEGV